MHTTHRHQPKPANARGCNLADISLAERQRGELDVHYNKYSLSAPGPWLAASITGRRAADIDHDVAGRPSQRSVVRLNHRVLITSN